MSKRENLINNQNFKDFRMVPVNTWDRIINQFVATRLEPDPEKKLNLIVNLVVNIRLLDKEENIHDSRNLKDNVESIHKRLIDEITCTFDSVKNPTDEYIYYARELLKKLPIRGGKGNLIDDIRSAAEYFEEGRDSDDPLFSFAGDLRKEVHRKLSPRIISRYLEPYLELIRNGNPEPLFKVGYFALARTFDPDDEDQKLIELAEELMEKLTYLWDYEKGDISSVKIELKNNLELFEKCFLRKEVESFLKNSTKEYVSNTNNLFDCLKRLSSFKMLLKKSYSEGRIGFFDYLSLDLGIGRLIFIFTNDLTNNHYETVSYDNFKECVLLVKELLGLLAIKGINPNKSEDMARELILIHEAPAVNIQNAKRIVQTILIELHHFMRKNIFKKLNHKLNRVLESYKTPTATLLPIKDRFFNNFIRTTEFHAVNEFIEKIITFLNRELATSSVENSLYGKYKLQELPPVNGDYESFIASTWLPTSEKVRPYLGGKGNGIIDMCNFGLRVPNAFILGLPICADFFSGTSDVSAFRAAIRKNISQLEEITGKQLGSVIYPLILSVRSGATISLPGSMCTILNVGITPAILKELSTKYGVFFASNIYLRFLKNVLVALEIEPLKESPLNNGNRDIKNIKAAIIRTEKKVIKHMGRSFLDDPFEQLVKSVELVFTSSRSKSVRDYLSELSIELNYGTAVTVQQMVFGNKNSNCLSGVIFTWNPITGVDKLFGEYREMTQGEDVVMGNVITKSIETLRPTLMKELIQCTEILEKELQHELDIEFTVEDGVLYLLQTRRASVSVYAHLVIDTTLMKKGVITVNQFRDRVERLCATNAYISVPRADEGLREWKPPLGLGVPVNHGVTWGALVLTIEKLEEIKSKHENIIFFAQSTNPSDFYVINNSDGIITVFPGRTSHAAITSITLNKPCVVGCSNAIVDLQKRTVTFKGETEVTLMEGEFITLDANGGYIYRGVVPLSHSFIRTHNILDTLENGMSQKQAAFNVENILKEKMRIIEKETGARKKNLHNFDKNLLKDKNVLVRLDLNVPFSNGVITDTSRIDATLPTIDYLIKAGATPILCSHLGEPDTQEKSGKSREEVYSEFSLQLVAKKLRSHFNDLVVFHEVSIATSGVLIKKEDIVKGKINLLENLRFAVGEKENDSVFARSLVGLSDGIFINDSFGTCHRCHASIIGVTEYADINLAGFLIEKELKYLGEIIGSPEKPFVGITGGSKISSKLGVIETLLQKIDILIVGGGIGYTLLKATGFNVQNSLVEESMVETAKKIMDKYGHKIVLPSDFVITDNFDFLNNKVGNLKRNVKTIPKGWESFDLGDESIEQALEILKTAKTILWNGPIGAFEMMEGSFGTIRLAIELSKMAENGKTVIIGGGDSASAVRMAGVSHKMTHVSTGGGASLEFLERHTLPGISVLDPEND